MADFCKQCSIEIFDKDFEELANLGGAHKLAEGEAWHALCEGCGPTLVNDLGECVDPHCDKHGEHHVR